MSFLRAIRKGLWRRARQLQLQAMEAARKMFVEDFREKHQLDGTTDEQDGGIGKVGYEINFNRVFFQYQPPRPLKEIDAELDAVEKRILKLLKEVVE